MSMLAFGPWLILVLALVSRFVPRGGWDARQWRTRIDLPLVLASGVFGGLALAFGFARRFALVYPISSSDFGQYCEMVDIIAHGDPSVISTPRSVVAGLLPAALMESLGVVDALTVSALLGSMVICASLYLWGRAVWGPTAGIAAVLLTGAIGPLAILPRDISFYSAIVASSVLAAAGVAATFRYRGPVPAAVAGVGIALGLLLDIRGVLWAVALVGPAVVAAAVRARQIRGAVLRCALVVTPIVASWWVGRAVFPEEMASLEFQAWFHVEEAVRRTQTVDQWSMAGIRETFKGGFVWGRSSPLELPGTMLFLFQLARSVPDAVRGHGDLAGTWLLEGTPWIAPALLAFVVSCVALVRRPWCLAAYVCSTVPFMATLHNTVNVFPQVRYLATGMIALPVILGVGFASMSEAGTRGGEARRSGAVPWRRLAALVGLLAMVSTSLPFLDTIHVPWRSHDLSQSEPHQTIERVKQGAFHSGCEHALRSDLMAGKPIETRLYRHRPEAAPPAHRPTDSER